MSLSLSLKSTGVPFSQKYIMRMTTRQTSDGVFVRLCVFCRRIGFSTVVSLGLEN